jgi:hypothetical protein
MHVKPFQSRFDFHFYIVADGSMTIQQGRSVAGTVQLPTNKGSGLTSFFLFVSSQSSLVFLRHDQLGAFDTVLTRS